MGQLANRAFPLIIIGGGTAALAAASEALELGFERIALIERREELGGECGLNACVPTDTMMTAMRILKTVSQRAPQYGITVKNLQFDFLQLRKQVEELIHEGSYGFIEDPRITVFHGQASFVSKREIRVGDQVLRGDKVLIATGSEPVIPEIAGLQEAGYWTFREITHLDRLPDDLLILGGYRVGVEFAQLFEWLGCHVVFLQEAKPLLPDEEPDISEEIEALLKAEGVCIATDCSWSQSRVERINGRKRLVTRHRGEALEVDAEALLVITGMKPQVDGLNLEVTGVQHTPQGIWVDDTLKTSSESIWAAGDVVGPYRFTHTADYQAVLAVRNMKSPLPHKVDYRALGWAIFTEPTIAHVGVTESQARQQYAHPVVLKLSSEEASRYRLESHRDGFIKILVDGDTDRVIGAHMIANHADDVAHTLMLAIQHQMTVEQMLRPIHIYPSLTQVIRKILESYPAEKAQQVPRPADYSVNPAGTP